MWDPALCRKPITFLELWAVTNKIRAFADHINSGTHIKLWEDNQAVVHIINAMTSKSKELMAELRVINKLLTKLGITIESSYLPSAVNTFADRLSRLKTMDDWTINIQAIQLILDTVPPTIDRFADHQNAIVNRFNSLSECPGSSEVDALSLSWGKEINYWNPLSSASLSWSRKSRKRMQKGYW